MENCGHHEEHIACLGAVPIFATLNTEEMMEIAQIASSRTFEKGEMVYEMGDTGKMLYVLYTGRVKVFRLNISGKEQISRVVEPGEFIGELALFSALPLTDYAEALERTTMCTLDGARFKTLLQKYPEIGFKIMDVMSRRLEGLEDTIEAINLKSVKQRLAQKLLEMSTGADEFSLPLSKGDLASMLGMSQETLSRALANLQNEGLITVLAQRKIRLLNREALADLEFE